MKLVDSSAWVEFLRRKGDPKVKLIVARLLEAEQAAYTCPIGFELLSGARSGEQSDLEQALALSHHFPFQQEDWRQAARAEAEKSFNVQHNRAANILPLAATEK
jgi:predicted nucleic acid-binding protein